MLPLEDTQRRRLTLLSAALCVASLLLAPLAARSSSAPATQSDEAIHVAGLPAVPLEETRAETAVTRDPFLADSLPMNEDSSQADGGEVVSSRVQAGAPMNVPLPPNAGASRAAATGFPVGIVVTAIVTGARAQALIDEGSKSRIVIVGDEVEGRHVSSISADGIHLDDGSILNLAERP